MGHRIELLFIGDAPESELERAKALANPAVVKGIEELSSALEAAGCKHEVKCQVVRTMPARRKAAAITVPYGREAAE